MITNTITLRNSHGKKTLEILPILLEKDFIKVETIIEQNPIPFLLQLPAQNLVTLLDFTGITSYEIWYFDANKKFKGKGFSSSSRQGNFRIQSQAKYILLIKSGSSASSQLREFRCDELLTK